MVVALLNHDFLHHEKLIDRLSNIALGKKWNPVSNRGGATALDGPASMAGVTKMDDGTLLEVRLTKDGLGFGCQNEDRFFEVYPLSASSGYVAARNARLVFRGNGAAQVELLALFGNLA